MSRFRLYLALLGVAAVLTSAPADDKIEHGFVSKVYKRPDGTESKYLVFVPYGYTPDTAYPVVLYPHGTGVVGDDGRKQVPRQKPEGSKRRIGFAPPEYSE
jgi:predicted peptidase